MNSNQEIGMWAMVMGCLVLGLGCASTRTGALSDQSQIEPKPANLPFDHICFVPKNSVRAGTAENGEALVVFPGEKMMLVVAVRDLPRDAEGKFTKDFCASTSSNMRGWLISLQAESALGRLWYDVPKGFPDDVKTHDHMSVAQDSNLLFAEWWRVALKGEGARYGITIEPISGEVRFETSKANVIQLVKLKIQTKSAEARRFYQGKIEPNGWKFPISL